MKNKKGFTLIEIIICISLIVVIGTASFFGIKTIRKNIIVDRLEKISDKILAAAEVYIKTNKEIYNQLYKEQNGVVIPLNALKNEGLIDFSNTKLTDADIEDEYVVALLGSESPTENECVSTTIQRSWTVNNKPIYICTKSDGTSNLISVGALDNNLGAALEQKYYFSGTEIDNWIQYNGTKYRIISIDTDDSITIYKTTNTDFGETFNGVTMDTSYVTNVELGTYRDFGNTISCPKVNESPLYRPQYNYSSTNSYKGTKVDMKDLINTSICVREDYYYVGWSSSSNGGSYTDSDYSIVSSSLSNLTTWIGYSSESYRQYSTNYYRIDETIGYKVHLKSCMKINGGTGDYASPYRLENKC